MDKKKKVSGNICLTEHGLQPVKVFELNNSNSETVEPSVILHKDGFRINYPQAYKSLIVVVD